MSISAEAREQVRQRANGACEYCGVTETDTGGELTVDHFHPQAHGGSDHADNLLYCCHRCNEYKAAYWPSRANDPALWNPRRGPRGAHLLLLADGTLYPISPAGEFTLRRLRLNRRPLVAPTPATRRPSRRFPGVQSRTGRGMLTSPLIEARAETRKAMTINISLPPETEERLRERAAASGQTVDSYVRQLVEQDVLGVNGGPGNPATPPGAGATLDEVLAPLREEFERSGMTEEELTQFLTGVRDEVRRDKPAGTAS